jgi:hypothetical protein
MTFAIVWGASLVTVPVWRFLVLSMASRCCAIARSEV